MTRLRRAERQAQTRSDLLAAAQGLFAREGYARTSVEAVAESAGYSKGAVYSNFESKEALFLAVLDAYGEESLRDLFAELDATDDARAALRIVARWGDERARHANWPALILEFARHAGPDSTALRAQERILRANWRHLGERLCRRWPRAPADPERLGALVFELAYAPALTFVHRPTPGDLIALALGSFLPAP